MNHTDETHPHHHTHLGPTTARVATTASGTRYVCPMHPEIVRDAPGSCPKCGMTLIPILEATPRAAEYTCPMHPEIRSPKPGSCPKCGKALVSVAGSGESDAPVASMRRSEDLQPGEAVIAVGFQDGHAVAIRGSVAALYPYDDGPVIALPRRSISAPAAAACSTRREISSEFLRSRRGPATTFVSPSRPNGSRRRAKWARHSCM